MKNTRLAIGLGIVMLSLAGCTAQPPADGGNTADDGAKTNNVVANNTVTSGKMKVCPEEMIVSRMPSIGIDGSGGGTSYYILNGERRETAEFDMAWVKANCKVSVIEVQ